MIEERATRTRVQIAHTKRPEHLAILGRTGAGKSSLIRHMASQDIRAGRGFLSIDLHNDTTPFLLRTIAHEENRRRVEEIVFYVSHIFTEMNTFGLPAASVMKYGRNKFPIHR